MKRKKILIAEDSQEVQEALKAVLGKEYEIAIVSTPKDAKEYNQSFDLLLTDFTFYDRDGRKIKEQGLDIIENRRKKEKGLSAILMSSGLNNGMINACKEMQVGSFAKYTNGQLPIDGEKLRKVIKEYIEE